MCLAMASAAAEDKSQVAFIREPDAVRDYATDAAVVQRMMDALIIKVTGKSDAAAGWRSLVSPSDRVGIKIATDGGRYFSTHVDVVEAIVNGLERAGVPRGNVVVWDGNEARLAAAGFGKTGRGYRVRPTPPVDGYDEAQYVTASVLGKLIWGDRMFVEKGVQKPWDDPYEEEQLSTTSYLSRVLTQDVTKVINVPVLSDSTHVGVAGCLYNMTVRNVDNWRRFLQQPASGDPYLPELYLDERVRGKVVLHIMDGLIAQYASGPRFEPNYAFHYGALIASRDPVAIDGLARKLIEVWRRQANLPPLAGKAHYLETAEAMGLGHLDGEKIVLEEVR